LGDTFNPTNDPSATCRAKRMVPRYSFIAATELTDSESATHLSGRVTEISRKGCYVDIMNALPVGDLLNLRISNDHGTFAAKGKIIYVHERIGMGVVFLDPPKEQLDVLEAWLLALPPTAELA
jgi:PilZ domain